MQQHCPYDVSLLESLVQCALELGQSTDVLKYSSALLRAQPNHVGALLWRGTALWNIGDFASAVKYEKNGRGWMEGRTLTDADFLLQDGTELFENRPRQSFLPYKVQGTACVRWTEDGEDGEQ